MQSRAFFFSAAARFEQNPAEDDDGEKDAEDEVFDLVFLVAFPPQNTHGVSPGVLGMARILSCAASKKGGIGDLIRIEATLGCLLKAVGGGITPDSFRHCDRIHTHFGGVLIAQPSPERDCSAGGSFVVDAGHRGEEGLEGGAH